MASLVRPFSIEQSRWQKKVTTMPSWLGKEGDLKSVPPHHVCFRLSSEAKADAAQWARAEIVVFLNLKFLLSFNKIWKILCEKLKNTIC